MAKRRLLAVFEVTANKLTCGQCRYLYGPHIPRCQLFTGTLDEDNNGRPVRADECTDAERRASNGA